LPHNFAVVRRHASGVRNIMRRAKDHRAMTAFSSKASAARGLVVLAVAIALAGCTGPTGDRVADTVLVAPGKYDIYTCPQLVGLAKAARTREQELGELMARASQGAGGELVNTLAYRTDYLQARAQQKMIVQKAQEKRCDEDVSGGAKK
jgi:hypothetical protein